MDSDINEIDYSRYEQYSELLENALKLPETLMLNEKAAKREDMVISLNGKIVKIPAKDILDGWDSLMDVLDLPLWKVPDEKSDTQKKNEETGG